MKINAAVLLVAVMAVGLPACSNKADLANLPAQPGGTGSNASGQGSAGTVAARPGTNADFQAQLAGRNVIYFDTDKFNIDNDDIAILQAQANWLKQYPATRATIEGHCDERGTREYNIALGKRRANAAKNYLVSLGIDARRLSTISYGKERPAVLGSDESAWSKNRRAASVTIDG